MRKKFFKQFLPLLLSVALAFQSLPDTVYAADSSTEQTVSEAAVADEETVVTDEDVAEAEAVDTEAAEAEEVTAQDSEDEIAAEEVIVADGTVTAAEIEITEKFDESLTDVTYDQKADNPLGKVIENLKEKGVLHINSLDDDAEVDSNAIIASSLTFTWSSVGADGKQTELTGGALPVNAGEYVLTIKADPAVITAEAVSINCVIEKATLTYKVEDGDWADVRLTNKATVGDLKEQIKEVAGLYLGDNKVDDASAYVDASGINIIVKAADQGDDAALDDKTVLDREEGVGYAFKVAATALDSANYEVSDAYATVHFAERADAEIVVTWLSTSDKDWVETVYTGKEVAEPTGFEYKVVDEDGETIKDYAKDVETYFADADGNRLESAPVDAGSYKYVISYEDSTGVYNSAVADFDVIINPATITVVPSINEELSFFYGQTASTVLSEVAYEVNGLPEGYEFDKNTFWGVSYGNEGIAGSENKNMVTQSFEPVFKVQQQKKDSDKTADWETIADNTKLETGYSYRIVLNGRKAVYGSTTISTSLDDTSVQAAETNYVVNVNDLYTGQTYEFTSKLKAASGVKIDVSGLLLKDANGNTGEDASEDKDGNKTLDSSRFYTKIYDGVALYADRSAYKKAVLKDEDGTEITDVASTDLTYTWKTFELLTLTDEDGKTVDLDNNATYRKYTYSGLPKDAGYYELIISYENAATGTYAEPVTIYYHIEKQKLKLVVSADAVPAEGFTVYDGDRISGYDLVEDVPSSAYSLMVVSGNDLEKGKLTDSGFSVSNNDFWIYGSYTDHSYSYGAWSVYKSTSIKDCGDVDSISYNRVSYEDAYEYGFPYRARAEVELSSSKGLDVNYEVVADSYPVNVKQMGNVEIRLEVNKEAVQKLTTSKVYDKSGFSVSYDGLVSAYTQIGDQDVTDKIELDYYWVYTDEYGNTVRTTWCDSDVNTYKLVCAFKGDDIYSRIVYYNEDTKETLYDSDGNPEYVYLTIAEFEITPRKVTVTPVSSNEIVAGLDSTKYYTNTNEGRKVSLLLDRTNPFTIEVEGAPNYSDDLLDTMLPYALNASYYYDDDSNKVYYPISASVTVGGVAGGRFLKYGETYTLTVKEFEFYPYDSSILVNGVYYDWNPDNYEFVYESVEFTVDTRSNSIVEANDSLASGTITNSYSKLAAQKVDVSGNTVITPIGGIPYYKGGLEETKLSGVVIDPRKLETGNYVTVKITAPDELKDDNGSYKTAFDNFTFYNSIKAAGGYLIGYNKISGMISAAFLVSEGETSKSFAITWEDGYTENYLMDLTQASLLSNIYEATVPKSLAFNVANKSMVVGESQQLDVKITKTVNTDVVSLMYRVVDGSAVSVTEDGYLTAIAPGKATVEVYPVYMDEDGTVHVFDTWKKAVKVAITVKNVSAPKISSVTAYDDSITVKYALPSDGYRQEIYVVEGKNVKAADIEAQIADMKQGKFYAAMILDAELEIRSKTATKYNSIDSKFATVTVTGLSANTDYTVYVRNVSAMEELSSGEIVTLSAAGSTKAVTTQKVQLDEVLMQFEGYVDNDLYPDTVEYPYTKSYRDSYIAKTISTTAYRVSLDQKTVQLTTYGRYSYKPANPNAETYDNAIYQLPLTGEDTANYQAVKLSYFAVAANTKYPVYDYSTVKSKTYSVKIGDRYYAKSALATVDKNGKVTLKGVGTVYIIAYDANSGLYDMVRLDIDSAVTSIVAKSATVQVGNTFNPVSDSYLTFYNGKTKLIGGASYYGSKINVTVKDATGSGLVQKSGNTFYATEAGQTVTLEIKSEDYPDATATMVVKTTALPAVKSVKTTDVTDHTAKLQFGFTATDYSDLKFEISVKDAKGQLIQSELINASDALSKTYSEYQGGYQNYSYSPFVFISDKNLYVYNLELKKYDRNASYTVAVKPIFANEVIGKAATAKMKTTNVPVSEVNHLNVMKNLTSLDASGAASPKICVYVDDDDWNASLSNVIYLTSNNTFTLRIEDNAGALVTGNDSVTWKSSNAKVASIKAVGYGASATLKTVRAGETTIECTSKVTKKVIARYTLKVKAAGTGVNVYGAYNNFDGSLSLGTDDYEQSNGYVVLTEKNPVRILAKTGSDYVTVQFTAPSDGKYTFSDGNYYKSDGTAFTNGGWLDEGQTVYGEVYCTTSKIVSVTPVHYTKLNVGAEAKGNITFTAPNTGVYAVYELVNGEKQYVDDQVLAVKAAKSINPYQPASSSTTVGIEKVEALSSKLLVSNLEADQVKYVSYTATIDGEYTFTTTDTVSENIEKSYKVFSENDNAETGYVSDGSWTTYGTSDLKLTTTLEAGQVIVLKLTGGDVTASTTVDVATPVITDIKDKVTVEYVNDIGTTGWYRYTVDSYDTLYTLNVTSAENCQVSYTTGGITSTEYKNTVSGGSAKIYGQSDLTANGKEVKEIYIKVVPDGSGEKASAKFTVTKMVPVDLNDTSKLQPTTVSNNTVEYYTFTAPEYGVYEFSVVAVDGKSNYGGFFSVLQYNKGFGYDPTGDATSTTLSSTVASYHDEKELNKGESVTFAVVGRAYGITEGASTNVSIKKITPTLLTEGEVKSANVTFGKSNKNTYQYYKFVATTAGERTYEFSLDSVSSNLTFKYSRDGIATDKYTTLSNGTKLTLSYGDSVIIRAMVDSADAGSAKLSVKDATYPEFKSGEKITVSENGSDTAYRTLIVTEPGRYMVSYDANKYKDTNVSIITKSGTQRYTDGEELVVTEVGTKLEFQVTNSVSQNAAGDYTATPTVKFTKVAASDIAVGDTKNVKVSYSASIAGERYQWYKFTVPESGRYSFDISATGTKEENISTYVVKDEITATSKEYSKVEAMTNVYLVKGDVYYIACGVNQALNSDKGEEVTQTYELKITANTKAAEALKLDTNSSDIKVSENAAYFTFTAAEDDYYTIDLVSGNGVNGRTISYAKNMDAFENASGTVMIKLRANDVVTVKVTGTAASADKPADQVIVKKLVYTKLELGKEANVSVKNLNKDSSARQYFLFVYPEDGTAEYGFTQVADGVTLTAVSNSKDLSEVSVANYASAAGKANEENLFYVTASKDDGEEITAKLTVNMVTYLDVTVGTESVELKKGQRFYYRFQPAEAGRYVISVKDTGTPVTSKLEEYSQFSSYRYNYYANQLNAKEFTSTAEMIFDGKDNYVQGYLYTTSANGVITEFKITKVEAEKTLDVAEDNEVKVSDGETVWVSFTAPETNYYTISLAKSVSVNAALYDGLDKVNGSTISTVTDKKLNKGQKVYVRLASQNQGDGSATISITKQAVTKLIEGSNQFTLNKATVKEAGETVDTEKYGVFTAEADGYYVIEASSTINPYGNVTVTVSYPYFYGSNNGSWSGTKTENADGSITYDYTWTEGKVYLSAGDSVAVKATNSSTESSSNTYVSVTRVGTFDKVVETTLSGKDQIVSYRVNESGSYTFVNTSTYGYNSRYNTVSYEVNGNEAFDDSIGYSPVRLELEAGNIVYFKVSNSSASEANKVKAAIGVYTPVTVISGQCELNPGGDYTFAFIAPHNDTYYIYFGNSATAVLTWEIDGTQYSDTYSSGSSAIKRTLTEGVKYTVKFTNNSETDTRQYVYGVKKY